MDTSKTSFEGTLKLPDGTELYTKTWPTASTPKARLVFLHGFSDHCNFHGILFPTLAEKGIKVYSFDQRGWGRSVKSKSDRGLTGPTSQVMDDISAFIRSLPADESNIPLFLMGHSMGGGETLVYAAEGPMDVKSTIRGYLAEAPLIALHPAAKPWKITVMLGRLAGKLLPRMQMANKLDPSKVTREEEVWKLWLDDPLCHDTGTLEGLAGMLDRTGDLDEGRVVLKEGQGEGGKTRLWIGHGTEDYICDYDASKRFFERTNIQDKELKTYEGMYHKLHSEPGNDKFVVAEDVAKWILDRSSEPVVVGKPKL